MIVSKNIERIEHSAVKLSITVAKEEVSKEYDALVAEYSKSVQIPGFRKGKVPAAVLERKFGDVLRVDTMSRVMEKSVEEAVKDIEEKPLAYSTPSIDEEPEFSVDKDFSFTVAYDVFPKVPEADWKGIEIEVPDVKVGPEDEAKELKDIQERNAIVVEKEAGAAATKGDVATVAYHELAEDGSIVPASMREDFTFEIGTGYNLYKFDDEVLGLKVGDSKKLTKTFAADYEYPELAGRTVTVELSLTKLKGKSLPALDDELAQDVSEKYKTLADLKADLKAQLAKRLEDKLRQLREKEVIDVLNKRTPVDLPVSMVNAELAMRWENLKQQMGMDSDEKLDRVLSFSGKTRADLLNDWRPNAEKAIATRLLLEKLTEVGKYECAEADLDAEFKRMSEESSLSVDEIKAEYEKRGSLEYLKDRIKEDKLLADIIAASKIKKGKKLSFVDLFADNQ